MEIIKFFRGNEIHNEISVLELESKFHFNVKRIYNVYNKSLKSESGKHAHICLKQILWCAYGSIEIIVDNGIEKSIFILDSPLKALYLGPGTWREIKWLKKNTVLSVIASELYDESDYIKDYDKFLEMVNKGYWDEKG